MVNNKYKHDNTRMVDEGLLKRKKKYRKNI